MSTKQFSMFLTLAILFASANVHAESKKIIKWVDKNGVTQYGDRPPLPSKAKKSSVLNKQGMTIEKRELKKAASKQDKQLAEQARYDSALLASYNSIEEIEISRKRNTKIDQLALDALEKKHSNLSARLDENNKTLLDFAKKNLPAPAETVSAIEKDTAAREKLDKRIADKKAVIDKINTRYERDKIRYAELESKRGELSGLKYKNKNIAELKEWRIDAQKRIDFYEAEALKHRRSSRAVPKHISIGLLNATRERERADQEIRVNEQAIKKSKEHISR